MDTNNIDSTVAPVKSSIKNKVLLAIGVVILIVFFSGGAYYLGAKGSRKIVPSTHEQSKELPSSLPTSSVSTPTTAPTQTPLFSGRLKRLDQNLKIFKLSESDKLNKVNEDIFIYYEAGKFLQGDLKGYTRIIALRPPEGPSLPTIYTLATKDFQSYILDDPENLTTKYPLDDGQNPYSFLDKSKIVAVQTLPTEQPNEIILDKNYALYSGGLYTDLIQTSKKDKGGNPIHEWGLITNFSTYHTLTSPITNLTIYFKPYVEFNEINSDMEASAKKEMQLKKQYLMGDTEVIAVDSVGLPIVYSLTTPNNIKSYRSKLSQYELALQNYQDQLKKYNNKEITQYPEAPVYVSLPTLGLSSSQIITQNTTNLFKEYETAIPGPCSISRNSKVVNILDSDVEQIGTVSNIPIYRLRDTNHPLYTLAYNNKLGFYERSQTAWDQVNKGMKLPTLEEYIAQNPLLFMKDHWNRWIALGEYDIRMPGGCGKPVVYLYPTKPTDVTVQFQVPIQFTTDIPTYGDFWKVQAYPNGTLINLKQELTSCQNINYKQFGSEYAKEACRTNTYPYLYWEGNVIGKNYPSVSQGWIVETSQLHNFFENKLTEIGLNNNEKGEFMSYWIQELLSKNAPYYRLSFLQTQDLNSLFPMNVNPKPDTTFRVFLDYSALTEKPNNLPQPQVLNKLIRKGFTLVEWGGIKK